MITLINSTREQILLFIGRFYRPFRASELTQYLAIMLSKVVQYGAVITVIVLAAIGVWEDFLAKKNTPRRVIISAILIAAALITIVNQHLADKQHEGDAGQIQALKTAVNKANKTQETNATTFS